MTAMQSENLLIEIRNADISEATSLAKMWFDGWHDAHASLVPEQLTRLRTLEDFDDRIRRGLANIRVAGAVGEPTGFYIVSGDELNQLYVNKAVRGSGIARSLISDAELRIAEHGHKIAWLACGIGNVRAARFYEKCGWHLEKTFTYESETPDGTFKLDVWRYEKRLAL